MKGWAARASLSQTQLSVDEFRDARYAHLVSARNQLAATNVATRGLPCMPCSGSPSSAQVYEPTVRAATAFYLVGALVGLFSALYTQSGARSAVDDYGLTLTRMLVTPQLSGIAAVLGVVITTMLSVAQFQSDPQLAATFHSQVRWPAVSTSSDARSTSLSLRYSASRRGWCSIASGDRPTRPRMTCNAAEAKRSGKREATGRPVRIWTRIRV